MRRVRRELPSPRGASNMDLGAAFFQQQNAHAANPFSSPHAKADDAHRPQHRPFQGDVHFSNGKHGQSPQDLVGMLGQLLGLQEALPAAEACRQNPCFKVNCKLLHAQGQATREIPCRFGADCERLATKGRCSYLHTPEQRAAAKGREGQRHAAQADQDHRPKQARDLRDSKEEQKQLRHLKPINGAAPDPLGQVVFDLLAGGRADAPDPQQEERELERRKKQREQKAERGKGSAREDGRVQVHSDAAGQARASAGPSKAQRKQPNGKARSAAAATGADATAAATGQASAKAQAKAQAKAPCPHGSDCSAFWAGKCRKHEALLEQLRALYVANRATVDAAVAAIEEPECSICLGPIDAGESDIALPCTHTFHRECITRLLETKWDGPRVTFGFCRCPLCTASLLDIPDARLQPILEPLRDLHREVQRKALLRLDYDGLSAGIGGDEADKAVVAMDRYAYYQCFKCSKPYFGGEAVCDAARGPEKFNPEELLCPQCCGVSKRDNCPQHGSEFLEYKCRFCCSVAVFFCFGTTHFCNACHDQHSTLTGADVSALPKCPAGPVLKQLPGNECPLHVYHPQTGEEFALGCGVCRNAQTF